MSPHAAHVHQTDHGDVWDDRPVGDAGCRLCCPTCRAGRGYCGEHNPNPRSAGAATIDVEVLDQLIDFITLTTDTSNDPHLVQRANELERLLDAASPKGPTDEHQ